MQLTLVRAFVAVAEARSFTQAAKVLAVPTSTVSRSVARLEATLGARLLERTTRKLTLSAAGRVYYEHARQALTALEEGESRVGELLGKPRGELKITIPIHLDHGFLARTLVEFSRAYPQLRVRILPTNRWLDLNEEGVDLALRIAQQSTDSELLVRELGVFQAWLVAAPEYLRLHGVPRHPSDLARHTFVNMQSFEFALRLIGPGGVTSVNVAGPVIANDLHFARQLVEQGAGIGALVFAPGERPAARNTLARVLPDYSIEGPRLFIVTPSRKSQPLRVRLLREFLIEAYRSVRTT
jgi:DNA-binding transcriptional LysR family regulator